MLAITEKAGGRIVNPDRMWHYTEGLKNYDPIWADHGIRILPGPSSMWFDAKGKRFSGPDLPGLRHPQHAEVDHRHRLRLLLVRHHAEDHREGVRALRLGAEPGPHQQGHPASSSRASGRPPSRSRSSRRTAWTSSSPTTLPELVAGMNKLTGDNLIDLADLKRQIDARDREIDNPYTKDVQVMGIRNALAYPGDTLSRTASAAQDHGLRCRTADRRTPQHPHPQDPRRPPDRPVRPRPGRRPASRSPGCTPRARSPASAAAASTATAPWKARSWAAACSRAARRDGPRRTPPRPDHRGRGSLGSQAGRRPLLRMAARTRSSASPRPAVCGVRAAALGLVQDGDGVRAQPRRRSSRRWWRSRAGSRSSGRPWRTRRRPHHRRWPRSRAAR